MLRGGLRACGANLPYALAAQFALTEKLAQLAIGLLRRLLGDVMAAIERAAGGVRRVVAPHREHVVPRRQRAAAHILRNFIARPKLKRADRPTLLALPGLAVLSSLVLLAGTSLAAGPAATPLPDVWPSDLVPLTS